MEHVHVLSIDAKGFPLWFRSRKQRTQCVGL